MTAQPFQPIGDVARWRIVYELLKRRSVGAVITYEELADALDLEDPEDRRSIQHAMRRAAQQYENEDKRAIEAVPNTGYRVVQPLEHLRLAKSQQRRSLRALNRGHSKVTHVDMSALEPEARKAFDVVAQAFSMQMDFNRRTDVRQRRLEEAMTQMAEQTQRSTEQLHDLQQRLARLENPTD